MEQIVGRAGHVNFPLETFQWKDKWYKKPLKLKPSELVTGVKVK